MMMARTSKICINPPAMGRMRKPTSQMITKRMTNVHRISNAKAMK